MDRKSVLDDFDIQLIVLIIAGELIIHSKVKLTFLSYISKVSQAHLQEKGGQRKIIFLKPWEIQMSYHQL